MQDSSLAGTQKAASIEQPGIDDHVQGKRGSKKSPTEPAFAFRATASTQNPPRGASGWYLDSRDGDPHLEIAAATIDKEWRRAFLLRFSPRVPQRHRVALVEHHIYASQWPERSRRDVRAAKQDLPNTGPTTIPLYQQRSDT
jgi:hypothetical protein